MASVLVAEGNQVHRRMVEQALGGTDHVVRIVGTTAEVEAAEPGRFDVMLVSDQLEDGDGLVLVRELASDPQAPPAVLLVDPHSDIEAAEAVLAGAVDLVVKGADMGGPLRLALVRALQRRHLLRTISDLERRLEQHTRVDPVSGVYTGAYFRELLHREVERVKRFGGVMALVRISRPTQGGIERTLGPHVRDSLVREVGAILRADLRVTDMAGCWPDGGFVIALTGTDQVGAQRVASRLSAKLAALESQLGVSIDLVPEPEVLGAGGGDVIEKLGFD
jgi:diguanylate cyclase (GGDEF)-like protein